MEDMEKILERLNDAQREAVEFSGAPQLVLAGAGSGKTRVLTDKVAWLISCRNVAPWRILAVTFTNKAAREMRDRVEKILGPSLGVQMCTFHSFGLRLLFRNRETLEARGYSPNFVVYDRSDSLAVLKRLLKELDVDQDRYSPAWALNCISRAKSCADSSNIDESYFAQFARFMATLYDRYETALREGGAFDFDDLLAKPLLFLREDPELLARERARLDWILVDEYQDVNGAQYALMRLLIGDSPNLMVVGDPDQAIYGWRGADYSTIMNFEEDFPNAKVTLLEENYRSTSSILDASNALIRHNANRREKSLRTDHEAGENVHVWYMNNGDEECDKLVREINYLAGIYHYSDIAVLYRMNALSRAIEQKLVENYIPYRVLRGVSFYERKEVRDVLAYMRLAVNPWDRVALNRIGNLPSRALGDRSREKLADWIAANAHGTPEDAWGAVTAKKGGLTGKAAAGAVALGDHMLKILESQTYLPAVVEWILTGIGYEDVLKKEYPADWPEHEENVREIASTAPDGENLSEVLSQIALYTDAEVQDDAADAVNLLTIHAAKGLEFPVVFIIGLEEGIFPHINSLSYPDTLEEERRLCYVAMTRAEERLYMVASRCRRLYGATYRRDYSRFLSELPDDCVEYRQQVPLARGTIPFGRRRPPRPRPERPNPEDEW